VATCRCNWSQAKYKGQSAPSKKQAEQNAARVALYKQFPDVDLDPKKGGQKRKERPSQEDLPAKSRLHQAMSVVRQQQNPGEPVTGSDIVYESEQDSDGGYTSSVSISFLQKRFSGQSQPSKKLAEHSAAEAAMTGMSFLIKKHMAKWNEERAAKKKASLAEFMEKRQAKLGGEPPKKKAKAA